MNSGRHILGPLKKLTKKIPLLGPSLIRLRSRFKKVTNSSEYWERRYKEGGDSGAGSYNRLAQFKANFLNEFVGERAITSVIEFGCGDGAQLKLAKYPTYTGIDVSSAAVERCRLLFVHDSSKQFLHSDVLTSTPRADLALSLDVVYHLIEDDVFYSYMRRLFASATRFVVVYSSNLDEKWSGNHVRHRQFTRWVEENEPEWRLSLTVRNEYPYNSSDPQHTSFADFYVFEKTQHFTPLET